MRSSVRQITVILLLVVLLAPGLLQARTPVRHRAQARVGVTSIESGFFEVVWNLLSGMLKNGGQLDPSGATGTTGTGDNGGQLDPSGSTATTDTGGQLDPSGTP